MNPMSRDAAEVILIFFGTLAATMFIIWIYVEAGHNRFASWVLRIVTWACGLGVGYVIAWAIHSLIIGRGQ